jgi:hypothetical protein
MASDDKKIKTNSAPENEAPPEKKSTSGAEPSKAGGGELAAASPSGFVRRREISSLCSGRLIATCCSAAPASPREYRSHWTTTPRCKVCRQLQI